MFFGLFIHLNLFFHYRFATLNFSRHPRSSDFRLTELSWTAFLSGSAVNCVRNQSPLIVVSSGNNVLVTRFSCTSLVHAPFYKVPPTTTRLTSPVASLVPDSSLNKNHYLSDFLIPFVITFPSSQLLPLPPLFGLELNPFFCDPYKLGYPPCATSLSC